MPTPNRPLQHERGAWRAASPTRLGCTRHSAQLAACRTAGRETGIAREVVDAGRLSPAGGLHQGEYGYLMSNRVPLPCGAAVSHSSVRKPSRSQALHTGLKDDEHTGTARASDGTLPGTTSRPGGPPLGMRSEERRVGK